MRCLCYHEFIDQITRRRLAWGAVAALISASAAAQEPPNPLSAAHGAPLAMAFPAGGMSAGRLNQYFDAAAIRAALPGPFVPAPKMSEPAPSARAALADKRPAAARLHQDLVVPVPSETPAYRRTFKFLLSTPDKTDRFDDLIIIYARKYQLDARFLKSIMAAESEFDPHALSPSGARGLMQVMPNTATEVGVAPMRLYDPAAGIKAGAAYLQVLFKTAWRIFNLKGVRYTDVPHWVMQRVIAAYHAGPRYLTRDRWYSSTRAYVRKVVLYYDSKVTDLRRPAGSTRELPSFSEAAAPSGTLF